MARKPSKKSISADTAGRSVVLGAGVDADGAARELLANWIRPEFVESVWLQVYFALEEYEERKDAGTLGAIAKNADEVLADIEKHAHGLVRALNRMHSPGVDYAIRVHRLRGGGQHGLYADWRSDLDRIGREVIDPLADTARGARALLPKPTKGKRGAPKKSDAGPSARDWLIGQLDALHLQYGTTERVGGWQRGDGSRREEFARALLAQCRIDMPDDISKILRNL